MKAFKIVVYVLFVATLASCQYTPTPEESNRDTAISSLRVLSKKMAYCYKYMKPPADLNGEQLLQYCTQDDTNIRPYYKDFSLKFNYEGGCAVVLLCSRDGQQRLAEDLSCTSFLDDKAEEASPAQPCEFTLKPHQKPISSIENTPSQILYCSNPYR
ncbi:MAG: hypothetical protein KQJ78_19660 [Deltaproteobacteria bacterium]|nr:hypothetical protein [Deltaproteobacteria bacterium]